MKFRHSFSYIGLSTILGFGLAFLAPSQSHAWQLQQAPLMTYWAQQVDPNNPRPEYPRPQMVRTNWLSLNGIWQFQSGNAGDPLPTGPLSGDILVPFPMESAISGVMHHYDYSWYQRTFTIPAGWSGQHVLLHFDAADWQCTPYVNGVALPVHQGGYDPFSYDITSYLTGTGPQTLTVQIYDPVDNANPPFPTGKQSVKYGGYDYTASSGLWQTVWLEPVPAVSISDIKLVPDVDHTQLDVTVTTSGAATGLTVSATALAGTTTVGTGSGTPGTQFTITIPNPTLWSPSNPYLYNLTINLQQGGTTIDSVSSYFGMRKVSVGNVGGYLKVLLNNQFTYMIGPLDQGYWPDGVYTAPTDVAMRSDIEQAKVFGFNLIRKHQKVEPPRWYYWADKLGVVVWQDMPATYSSTSPAPVNSQFELELNRMVTTHWNYPSIIVWTIYNEGWGQPDEADVSRICSNIATLDPSRLINEGSGGNYYDIPNLLDVHHYPQPQVPTSSDRAVANSEFGGIYLPITGHTWAANGQGVGDYVTATNPTNMNYLIQSYSLMLADDVQTFGLSEAAITQITDCETEMNGLFTYDRKVRKPNAAGVQAAVFSITAPFTNTSVVPTSQTTPQSWRYTTTTPANNWYTTNFNASAWKTGTGGFGSTDPGVTPNTSWTTAGIWLRRTFNPGSLTAQQISNLAFTVYHDEDVQIYINGVLAGQDSGYTTSYVNLAITPQAQAAIIPNATNVLAVYCDNTTGGQFIDVGINDRSSATLPTPAIPLSPTGVTAVAESGAVGLSWNASPTATSYNIKRSLTSGGPYTTVGSPPSTGFTDPNTIDNSTYYYVVSAVNAGGESSNSAEISVTTSSLIGPVAFYLFEGNVLDSSGNANNGTNNGATFTTGKVGAQAAQFNGVSSWVQIPLSIGSTSFTIAMWVKTTDTGNSGQWYSGEGLVDGDVPGTANDFGTALSGGKFSLGIGNPDTTLTSSKSINDGTWHHVAATWDVNAGTMQLYIDGVLDSSGTGPTGARNAVTNGLHIGNSHDGVNYFKGTLDNVELYSRVLTPAEIDALATLPAQTLTAVNVTPDSATFNGSVDPSGNDTTVYFQYGTTMNYGQMTVGTDVGSGTSTVQVTANVTGLLPGTTYYYRLVATNANGTVYGATQTFVTGGTASSDSPTMPPWGLAALTVLLFVTASFLIRKPIM